MEKVTVIANSGTTNKTANLFMKLTDKRFWITIIPISLVITLLCGVTFYRHNVKFEEIGSVKNTVTNDMYNFYPYGFALIHNDSDLEYYKNMP